ncbi:LytTR family DNA-binding domain-containing protein [uncultured Formosa sp.]|uniref:LytR/AlgR family response regulator transcription factor n=1 Tax=uncultured Formosa sp. TaxID=255435 RepID=UPI0034598BAD
MQQITLNTIDVIHIVHLEHILYCKSKNSYTTFYLTNHLPIKISRSIKEIEKQLYKSAFIRPHQSYLVNPIHIVQISKTNGYSIVLSDKSLIPISIRKRKEILQILLKK